MKAHLLDRSRDLDWKWVLQAALEHEANRTGRHYILQKDRVFDRQSGLPWNERELTTDLALETLFGAMARDDDCVFETARKVILAGVKNDLDTVLYRQRVLQDCLNHPDVVRKLYTVAVEALAKRKGGYLGSPCPIP